MAALANWPDHLGIKFRIRSDNFLSSSALAPDRARRRACWTQPNQQPSDFLRMQHAPGRPLMLAANDLALAFERMSA